MAALPRHSGLERWRGPIGYRFHLAGGALLYVFRLDDVSLKLGEAGQLPPQ